MNIINVKCVYCLFVTFLILMNVTAAEETTPELSSQELQAVAKTIKAAEDALLNVRIDSNALVEQGPSSSGPWEPTPVCLSATTFLDNPSTKRIRLDIHKIVLKWKKGAAPYLEESYSISFDGLQGRRKEISSSYDGKRFDKQTGSILSEAPIQMTGASWYNKMIGIYATLFFHFLNLPEPLPTTFSAHFEGATDPNYLSVNAGIEFKVIVEKLNGIECIKMAYIRDSSLQRWWLVPNQDFALLRYDELRKDQEGNWQVKSSINVTKFKEVAKDIWWPIEACFVESPRETGQPWKRIVYQASNVIANDPNFDESVFTIRFPKGHRIDDQVNKKSYIIDSNLTMIPEPNYSPHFKIIRQNNGR